MLCPFPFTMLCLSQHKPKQYIWAQTQTKTKIISSLSSSSSSSFHKFLICKGKKKKTEKKKTTQQGLRQLKQQVASTSRRSWCHTFFSSSFFCPSPVSVVSLFLFLTFCALFFMFPKPPHNIYPPKKKASTWLALGK